jgi:hypothetical protein
MGAAAAPGGVMQTRSNNTMSAPQTPTAIDLQTHHRTAPVPGPPPVTSALLEEGAVHITGGAAAAMLSGAKVRVVVNDEYDVVRIMLPAGEGTGDVTLSLAQLLAGFEVRHLFSRHQHLFARFGIATHSWCTFRQRKTAKTANLDALTFGQSLGHGIKNGFNRVIRVTRSQLRVAGR